MDKRRWNNGIVSRRKSPISSVFVVIQSSLFGVVVASQTMFPFLSNCWSFLLLWKYGSKYDWVVIPLKAPFGHVLPVIVAHIRAVYCTLQSHMMFWVRRTQLTQCGHSSFKVGLLNVRGSRPEWLGWPGVVVVQDVRPSDQQVGGLSPGCFSLHAKMICWRSSLDWQR